MTQLHRRRAQEFKIKHSIPLCDDPGKRTMASFVADAKRLALQHVANSGQPHDDRSYVVEDLLGPVGLSYVTARPIGSTAALSVCSVTAAASSAGIPISKSSFRHCSLPHCPGQSAGELFLQHGLSSEPFVISGVPGSG